jgi:hypothetical protein
MNLDELRYGNPNQEQLPYLHKETYVDVLFNELSTFSYPRNSSEATREELNQVVDAINTIKGKEEFEKRYRVYDRGLLKYFKDGLTKNGEKIEEMTTLVDNIIEDTLPLLIKLKYFHQRPRPFQLADYYKLKLFPYKSFSADSPSFPSGHSFQGKILTEVVGNHYPETYSYMKKLFDDISYSRLYLGLHYQSDIDVGIFCAEKVLELKEFKSKYKL